MLAVCHSEGHLLVWIFPARVDSSMLCKASTSVAQVTGCLPLPVSHSLRISVFICTGLFKHLCAIIWTLDPFLSSRRKMPKRTYLVAISTGMLTTLPSVHVNFSSSGRVGLVPGMYVLCGEVGKNGYNLLVSLGCYTKKVQSANQPSVAIQRVGMKLPPFSSISAPPSTH